MADWLDDIEAQADATSPYYLPRLIAEIRRLRQLEPALLQAAREIRSLEKRIVERDRIIIDLRAELDPPGLEIVAELLSYHVGGPHLAARIANLREKARRARALLAEQGNG